MSVAQMAFGPLAMSGFFLVDSAGRDVPFGAVTISGRGGCLGPIQVAGDTQVSIVYRDPSGNELFRAGPRTVTRDCTLCLELDPLNLSGVASALQPPEPPMPEAPKETKTQPEAAEAAVGVLVALLSGSTRAEPVTTSQHVLADAVGRAADALVTIALDIKAQQPTTISGPPAGIHPVEGMMRQAMATDAIVQVENARAALLRLVSWPRG